MSEIKFLQISSKLRYFTAFPSKSFPLNQQPRQTIQLLFLSPARNMERVLRPRHKTSQTGILWQRMSAKYERNIIIIIPLLLCTLKCLSCLYNECLMKCILKCSDALPKWALLIQKIFLKEINILATGENEKQEKVAEK